jgi:hypothetical protein
LTLIDQEKKKINYYGWLGHGNVGDEALFMVNKKIFSEYDLVPSLFERGRFSAQTKKIGQVSLIGGSSGIPEWTQWIRPTKYNYVFGASVQNPKFYGKIASFDKVGIDKLRSFNFRHFGVRGNRSKALLKEWGIESEVISDPCLSWKSRKHVIRDSKKIAINVGSAGLQWGKPEVVLREMGEVCRILKRDGYDLVLIPFSTWDVPDTKGLSQETGTEFFSKWFDADSSFELISKCKLLIGTKIHSLVFSAASYTPFICLAYVPESLDFVGNMGFSDYSIPTSEVTAEGVMTLFHDLINKYESNQSRLVNSVEVYREKQRRFVSSIVRDIESLPENKWSSQGLMRKSANGILWTIDSALHIKMRNAWRIWNRLFFLHATKHLI